LSPSVLSECQRLVSRSVRFLGKQEFLVTTRQETGWGLRTGLEAVDNIILLLVQGIKPWLLYRSVSSIITARYIDWAVLGLIFHCYVEMNIAMKSIRENIRNWGRSGRIRNIQVIRNRDIRHMQLFVWYNIIKYD
jgi:hypothetical protein